MLQHLTEGEVARSEQVCAIFAVCNYYWHRHRDLSHPKTGTCIGYFGCPSILQWMKRVELNKHTELTPLRALSVSRCGWEQAESTLRKSCVFLDYLPENWNGGRALIQSCRAVKQRRISRLWSPSLSSTPSRRRCVNVPFQEQPQEIQNLQKSLSPRHSLCPHLQTVPSLYADDLSEMASSP